MRAALWIVLAACLGGCLPPINADTVELAWERCNGTGAAAYRVSQCTAVIDFDGTPDERRTAALIARGSIRTTEGEYNRALADLGRALRIDANNAQVYLQRGIIHQARGAFDVAVRDFDQALALAPGLQPALEHRAEVVQQRASAYIEEIAQLDEYLQQSPGNADLLNSRCWLRTVNNDDLDLALADCDASLAAVPNDANVLDSRGLVYLKRGEYAASLTDYEAALALEPDRGHFLYGRGLARIAVGMHAEGNADLARAEQLEPGITRQYQDYNILPPKPESEGQDAD